MTVLPRVLFWNFLIPMFYKTARKPKIQIISKNTFNKCQGFIRFIVQNLFHITFIGVKSQKLNQLYLVAFFCSRAPPTSFHPFLSWLILHPALTNETIEINKIIIFMVKFFLRSLWFLRIPLFKCYTFILNGLCWMKWKIHYVGKYFLTLQCRLNIYQRQSISSIWWFLF